MRDPGILHALLLVLAILAGAFALAAGLAIQERLSEGRADRDGEASGAPVATPDLQ